MAVDVEAPLPHLDHPGVLQPRPEVGQHGAGCPRRGGQLSGSQAQLLPHPQASGEEEEVELVGARHADVARAHLGLSARHGHNRPTAGVGAAMQRGQRLQGAGSSWTHHEDVQAQHQHQHQDAAGQQGDFGGAHALSLAPKRSEGKLTSGARGSRCRSARTDPISRPDPW